MTRAVLAALLLLAVPAAASGAAPPRPTSAIAGLHEWNERRAESSRLLGELKAAPARAKAVQRFEQEWQGLDRLMQKVQTLQTQGRLDAKTARRTADDLGAQIRRLESAQEEIRNNRSMDTTAFQNFDQKANQLMNMLSAVLKTMGELRQIGAGSRSGL